MSLNNSFNSLEKLMEFGMSMAVAQQMIQTMNHAMSNMQTPQFQNLSMQVPKQIYYYALVNNIPQGPFSENDMNSHILANRVSEETLIWHNGLSGWIEAKQVAEINKLFLHKPPTLK